MSIKPYLILLPLLFSLNTSSAAIVITVTPDDMGGTIFTFDQLSPNPSVPVEHILGDSFRVDLPASMFNLAVVDVSPPGTASDILGGFFLNADFLDTESNQTFNLTYWRIASDFSSVALEFDRDFTAQPGQTDALFELILTTPGNSFIPPEVFVEGSHTVNSLLLGSVTVNVVSGTLNVVPEPTSLLYGASTCFLMLCRRQRR